MGFETGFRQFGGILVATPFALGRVDTSPQQHSHSNIPTVTFPQASSSQVGGEITEAKLHLLLQL
ncbi:MAG: hypothetical protein MKZ95_07425 [Pirellulales bacterium]|nr:hypothetical protein [Pirellulales bacterium]